MKSKLSYETCDMYQDHGGEYYQGCWEWNDMCYMAIEEDMVKLGYKHHCSENHAVCPYHIKVRSL